MMGGIERIELGEVPYCSARTPPGVTTTSLAQLAARQGRSVPSEAEVRDAVAKELGAA